MTFEEPRKTDAADATEPATIAEAPASEKAPAPAKPRRPRGFAAMDRKRVSEIASKGGRAAHKAGTAHEFTSEEARAAAKAATKRTGPRSERRIKRSPVEGGSEGGGGGGAAF